MVSDVAAETSVAQIPCIVINYRGLAGHWISPPNIDWGRGPHL